MTTYATLAEPSALSNLKAFIEGRGAECYRELMRANGSSMDMAHNVAKGGRHWERQEQINIEVEETKLWLSDGLSLAECAKRHGIAASSEYQRFHTRGIAVSQFTPKKGQE
jgi:hypothetical protein